MNLNYDNINIENYSEDVLAKYSFPDANTVNRFKRAEISVNRSEAVYFNNRGI
jgi:hypothetical protein